MTDQKLDALLVEFNRNPGASLDVIREFELTMNFSLPSDYVEFLKVSNGGEGFIGESYVMLWPIESLVELNEGYEVADYAPDLLIIGSNGGGEALVYRRDSAPPTIGMIPFVGFDIEHLEIIDSDFVSFLRYLHQG